MRLREVGQLTKVVKPRQTSGSDFRDFLLNPCTHAVYSNHLFVCLSPLLNVESLKGKVIKIKLYSFVHIKYITESTGNIVGTQ